MSLRAVQCRPGHVLDLLRQQASGDVTYVSGEVCALACTAVSDHMVVPPTHTHTLTPCSSHLLSHVQVVSQLGAFIRGAMQEVVSPESGFYKVSPLANRQRIRALLAEGNEDEAGFEYWIGELLSMKPQEVGHVWGGGCICVGKL